MAISPTAIWAELPTFRWGATGAENGDGSRVLTVGYDGTARVWDAATGEELLTLAEHTDYINQPTWSVDGSRILITSSDGTARVWDVSAALNTGSLTVTSSLTLGSWCQFRRGARCSVFCQRKKSRISAISAASGGKRKVDGSNFICA